MKKLALTIVCGLAMTGAALAQGTLNWGTISAASMTAVTNSQTYSPLFGGQSTGSGATGVTGTGFASLGTGFYYELLYNTNFTGSQVASPTTLAGLALWQDTGLSASNNPASPGRLANINPNNGASVPSTWNNGTTNNIMLVGWSANLGSTWSGVGGVSNIIANWAYTTSNSFFGETLTGYLNPLATGVSPGSVVWGGAPTTQGLPIKSLLTPLYLLPVPEPATWWSLSGRHPGRSWSRPADPGALHPRRRADRDRPGPGSPAGRGSATGGFRDCSAPCPRKFRRTGTAP